MPVFLAAISTILGAILFLRFGCAVGQAGFLGAILIVLLGLTAKRLQDRSGGFLVRHPALCDVLWVHACESVLIE